MRSILLGALMALVASTARGENDAQHGEHRRLQLCWLDADGRYPLTVEPMKREVASTLAAIGVEVVWLDALRSTSGPVLAVTLMRKPPPRWRVPAHAMGATPTHANRRDAVFVFLPPIMRALGLEPRMKRLPTPRERIGLSRAIARVVVHELVHALAPDVEHGEGSVMQASLSRHALQHGATRIEPEVADAVRAGLARRRTDRAP